MSKTYEENIVVIRSRGQYNIRALNNNLRKEIIAICNAKIASKGENVGLLFYSFFKIKNDDPELLMEVAQRWIFHNRFDHFEKALKIKKLVEKELVYYSS